MVLFFNEVTLVPINVVGICLLLLFVVYYLEYSKHVELVIFTRDSSNKVLQLFVLLSHVVL